MASEWREMAATVPDTLREACISEVGLGLIELAIDKLEAQHEALRAYRVGVPDGYHEPRPAGVLPITLLEHASRDIKRCSALQGLAASALPLCCEGLNLVPSPVMTQRCDNHSDDALRNADHAQLRLCIAASLAMAASDAVRLAGALPAGDILQSAWLLAAEQLQGHAIDEAWGARSHVCKMRDALNLQLFYTSSILMA